MLLESLHRDDFVIVESYDEFVHLYGPFNSKNDVYRWFKGQLGNKSLYFGKGLQSNILKGSGGSRDAWYGRIERRSDGNVYFWSKFDHLNAPEVTTKVDKDARPVTVKPLSDSELANMIKSGVSDDDILNAAIERGITNYLGIRIARGDLELSDILRMELVDYFGLEAKSPEPKSEVERSYITRGIDLNDFLAAVLDGRSDAELASLFSVSPNEVTRIRLSLGLKRSAGRPRQYDYDEIIKMFEAGASDSEIMARTGASRGVLNAVITPLRISKIEEFFRNGVSPIVIADKLNIPLRIVNRHINAYREYMSSLEFCKIHKLHYNKNFGCLKCDEI